MQTTAQKVLQLVAGCAAVTLYGGYAVKNSGDRVTFEAARITEEKRNASGRCTHLVAQYADGSKLKFKWSESSGARYQVA